MIASPIRYAGQNRPYSHGVLTPSARPGLTGAPIAVPVEPIEPTLVQIKVRLGARVHLPARPLAPTGEPGVDLPALPSGRWGLGLRYLKQRRRAGRGGCPRGRRSRGRRHRVDRPQEAPADPPESPLIRHLHPGIPVDFPSVPCVRHDGAPRERRAVGVVARAWPLPQVQGLRRDLSGRGREGTCQVGLDGCRRGFRGGREGGARRRIGERARRRGRRSGQRGSLGGGRIRHILRRGGAIPHALAQGDESDEPENEGSGAGLGQ